ncbi:MAG TPA: hypothetical protein VM580_09375 [Labilithrix sp.]|nr:hypothetical protein [Labilithrix sp.]
MTEAGDAGTQPEAGSSVARALGSCTSDSDCGTWSSYCADTPCVCRVVSKADPAPRCSTAATVQCFADPCMKKAAACQEGRCVLVMGQLQ